MIFPNLLKMMFLNIMLHFLYLLQLFSLTHKFKVTQALLARQGLGVITSCRCSHILTSRESWVSKSWESWWFNHFLSHCELLWDSYEIDYDMTLNDLINLLGAAESAMIWSTGRTHFIKRINFPNFHGHWKWWHRKSRKTFSSQLKGIDHSQLGWPNGKEKG